MRKSTLFITMGVVLVLLGSLMFVLIMTFNDWDFSKFKLSASHTETIEITEDFADIYIETDVEDVVFLPSEDNKCKVVILSDDARDSCTQIKDNTLEIKLNGERKWHQVIFNKEEKVTVYLPKNKYNDLIIKGSTSDIDIAENLSFENLDIDITTGDVINRADVSGFIKIELTTGDVHNYSTCAGEVFISATTGDIRLEGLRAVSVDIKTGSGDIEILNVICSEYVNAKLSTGDAEIEELSCKNLTSNASTGYIEMRKVTIGEKLLIERSTGDVHFGSVDAGEIKIVVSTGDVKGSFKTPKIFAVKSGTGNVDVPFYTSGGICEISATTGDIKITVEE